CQCLPACARVLLRHQACSARRRRRRAMPTPQPQPSHAHFSPTQRTRRTNAPRSLVRAGWPLAALALRGALVTIALLAPVRPAAHARALGHGSAGAGSDTAAAGHSKPAAFGPRGAHAPTPEAGTVLAYDLQLTSEAHLRLAQLVAGANGAT